MHPLRPHRHGDADRLSPLDMSNLRVEEHGMPMHVAALALLDGRPLVDENGDVDLRRVRGHVEQRIAGSQRLRQVLVWSKPRHRTPVWEDDPAFSLDNHVKARRLPWPGDQQTLLQVASDLNAPALERSRPLWDLWLLGGLADGRVAMLLRLHHVVADGAAALDLFSSLLDLAPGTPPPAGGSERAAPPRQVSVSARLGDARSADVDRLEDSGSRTAMWLRRSWAVARLGPAPRCRGTSQ